MRGLRAGRWLVHRDDRASRGYGRGQLDHVESRLRRSGRSWRAHVTLRDWWDEPVAPTPLPECWPTVAEHQLLDRYTVMVRLQFESLVGGSRVLPLAALLQSQTIGPGALLAGFAAILQGIVQRSNVWEVERLRGKV